MPSNENAIEQLYCPFCGRNTSLSKINLDSFTRFSGDWKLLMVQRASAGPGRGHKGVKIGGFRVDEEASKTIAEMLEDSRLKPYAEAVKNRLLLILSEYLRVGAVTPEELEALQGR